MHVFISWSGELSRQLAQAIRNWLPATLQYVKPYFTPADIEKGAKWDVEISNELAQSPVCIIALTRESLTSQWIAFEAGAISRSVEKSRVCTILFDIEATDLQGPLARFQATKFSKAEILQLMNTINANAGNQALAPSVLESVFNKWWPDLESEVQRILAAASSAPSVEVRSDRSLLEETLALVRNIAQEQTEIRAGTFRGRALLQEQIERGAPVLGEPTLTVKDMKEISDSFDHLYGLQAALGAPIRRATPPEKSSAPDAG
jgi:TIR domain